MLYISSLLPFHTPSKRHVFGEVVAASCRRISFGWLLRRALLCVLVTAQKLNAVCDNYNLAEFLPVLFSSLLVEVAVYRYLFALVQI